MTLGWTSALINERVSLWDHCTVWWLGLHHSHKLLSHLRKLNWPGGVLSIFFRGKLSFIFLTFILTNSIMTVKLKKSVRSTSYLTTQPSLFSILQQSNLGIFQLSPGYPLFFSQLSYPPPPHYPVPFPWVGNSPGIFQPAPYPISFAWVGISQYLSAEPHSVSRPWVGMPWIFHLPPSSIFPTRRGQVTCSTTK